MLTAANEKTKKIQEVVATDRGELMGIGRAAMSAFVTAGQPIAPTGPCRCIGIAVFPAAVPASMRVTDSGTGAPIMEAYSMTDWWANIIIPNGVVSTGNLLVDLTGTGSYGYVYWVPD